MVIFHCYVSLPEGNLCVGELGWLEVYSHPCSIPQYCHCLMLIPINTLFKSMIPNNHRRHGELSTGLVHIMSDLLMLLRFFCFCHLRSPLIGRISPHIFVVAILELTETLPLGLGTVLGCTPDLEHGIVVAWLRRKWPFPRVIPFKWVNELWLLMVNIWLS